MTEFLFQRCDPSLADRALAVCRGLPAGPALFDGQARPQSRVASLAWLYPTTNPAREVYNAILTIIDEVNDAFRFALESLGAALQFTRYDVGGHYAFHTDWHSREPVNRRKLSFTLNLTPREDYDGGDFELCTSGGPTRVMLTYGTVLVFPAFLPHRVTPVTKGTRLSLVAWAEGDPLR